MLYASGMDLREWLDQEKGRGARLAEAMGVSPAFVSQIVMRSRPAPAEHCVVIERESGGAVRRWEVRPSDWHRIWPELIGAEGAPRLPTLEARNAA
jgi:DNA-binding transcriptional regulator YdaS (Cro superfamily)